MIFSRRTIFKSFFWKLFERISVQLVQFVVTIVLARLLSPAEYGIIALIAIFIQLCEVIIEGGLNTALVQKKDADNVDFSTIFIFSLGMAVLLYGMLFLLAPAISSFYRKTELIPVIRVLSLSLPFYAFNSIQRAYVSKNMLFQKQFFSSLGAVVLSGCLGILMALNNYGVWALVAQNISAQLITTVIMWFTIKWRPVLVFSISRFKDLFNYGWKIFGASFLVTLFVNLRKLLIGKLYAADSLAYYEKGEQIPSFAMNSVFSSVQSILLPTFSEAQDDRPRVKSMMRRSVKLSCFFVYPLMVGMIVAAKPLVVFLLTEKWLSVVPFVQILCIANFFLPITIPNWEAVKALGYSGITLKLEIIKKIVDISILAITACVGVHAIAWGCVLYNLICVFINLKPNKKLLNYGVFEQVIDVTPSLLISLVMGAIVYWIQFISLPTILILILQFFAGGICYIGFCLLIKEDSMMYLLQIVKERFLHTHEKQRLSNG